MSPSPPDPEEQRIAELLARVRRDQASEAEREELALYAAERPGLEARMRAAAGGTAAPSELDTGWLERVEADQRLQRRERGPLTRAERGLGVALAASGMVLVGVSASALGPVLVLGGTGLLLWSFVRVRLQTLGDDPYKDIEQ